MRGDPETPYIAPGGVEGYYLRVFRSDEVIPPRGEEFIARLCTLANEGGSQVPGKEVGVGKGATRPEAIRRAVADAVRRREI